MGSPSKRPMGKQEEGRGLGEQAEQEMDALFNYCPDCSWPLYTLMHTHTHIEAHAYTHAHMHSSTKAGARCSLNPLHSFHAVNDSRGKPCFRFGDC